MKCLQTPFSFRLSKSYISFCNPPFSLCLPSAYLSLSFSIHEFLPEELNPYRRMLRIPRCHPRVRKITTENSYDQSTTCEKSLVRDSGRGRGGGRGAGGGGEKRPVKLSGARRKIHFSDYNRPVLDNASTSGGAERDDERLAPGNSAWHSREKSLSIFSRLF